MKKFLSILLVALMMVSLIACSANEKKTDTTKADIQTPAESKAQEPATGGEDGSLKRVQDAGKLVVAAEGNWVPYVYNEDGTGELTGYEIDIAKEICKRLGVEPDFQISSSWDGVEAGLDAGRYDCIICGMNPKPERLEKYAMTAAYGENPFCLVVAKDNEEIKDFKDLDGKLCANALNSTAGDLARKYGAELSDANLTQAMDLLVSHRADAYINSVAAIDSYLEEKPDAQVKTVAVYEPEAGEEWMLQSSAAFQKKDQELADKVSEIIQEMVKDGTCYDLTVKYFGKNVADNTSLFKK